MTSHFERIQKTSDHSDLSINEVSEDTVQTVKRVKRENTAGRRVFFLLFLLTGLTVAMNWLDLSLKRRYLTKPYYLAFTSTSSNTITYSVEMEWDATPLEADSRPSLYVEGRKVPCTIEVPPTMGKIQRLALTWSVPSDCYPGAYKGTLRLYPFRMSNERWQNNTMDLRIRLHVMSLWRQWWIVSAWGMFLGLIYVISFPFFVWWRPQPKGKLVLWASDQTLSVEVFLRPRRISWIMPWLRGAVNLRWISKEAPGASLLNEFSGRFIFDRFYPPYPIPLLELEETWDRVQWFNVKTKKPNPKNASTVGTIQVLFDWGTLVFWSSDRRAFLAMWFEPHHG